MEPRAALNCLAYDPVGVQPISRGGGSAARQLCVLIFFFQAEDGIRDIGVTGVQTCALPIWVRLVWVNSPANPTGRVLPAAHLRKMADWARERGAVLASDECYLDLAWDAEPVSVLCSGVSGGTAAGLLAVYSLSKRSNLAGYRAGFLTGDP